MDSRGEGAGELRDRIDCNRASVTEDLARREALGDLGIVQIDGQPVVLQDRRERSLLLKGEMK